MATKKKPIKYKEPASYFNADMRKAAEEWDKSNPKKDHSVKKNTGKGKKK